MYLWKFHASAAWLESNQDALDRLGNVAIVERPGRARSLVEVTCTRRTAVTALKHRFGGSVEDVRDWEKKYLAAKPRPPLRIGRRLVVLAEAAPPDRTQLIIPAAGAFGTGEHVTTAMCLRLLEEATRSWDVGWSMLDLGSGTGILALAARRFGASEVLGLDNDPRAIAHAQANARLNKIRDARFVRQDLLRWEPSRRSDIITANLFSELLIAAAPNLRRALRSEGRLIVSGILREQAASVVRALRNSELKIEEHRRRGKWVAFRCTL